MQAAVEPVVREADENRATYEAFCRSLSQDELQTVIPGMTWRVRDYIAHLASIDIYVGEWFEHQADGKRWRPTLEDGSPFNIDTWNEDRVIERKDATVEELLSEAATHRARLWAAVDRFSPELLATEFPFHEQPTSFLRYLKLWVAHDPAHSADMLRGLPERRKDPALRAWIEKYRIPVA